MSIFTGKPVHHFEVAGSTNQIALECATCGDPEGTVVIADQQTSGRGRGGHSWSSDPGGLYLSVILRPNFLAKDALFLSLAAGLAVREAIQQSTNTTIDLRWPNDVMLPPSHGEKKIGGILAELASEGDVLKHVVLGIGLNLNQTRFPAELSGAVSSLRLFTGAEVAKEAVLAALLESLDAEYAALRSEKAGVISRFEAASSYARGAHVSIFQDDRLEYSGITRGLDANGFLRVETANGIRTVLNGGVRKDSTQVH
jgi:BirA family biotin operon repressor/biotin-[acetyl-CoA-carboxylase] ligase